MQSPRWCLAATCTPRRMRLAALVGSALAVVIVTIARLAVSLVAHGPPDTNQAPSVLHANAAKLPPLAPGKLIKVKHDYGLDAGTFTTTTTFPLHGNTEQRGIHFRLRNVGGSQNPALVEQDATLVVVVLTDGNSYGPDRKVDALFSMLRSATLRAESMSVTLLTSNMDEFHVIRARLYDYITDFMQLSLLFRNDFKPATRRAVDRYAMLARYRNFALHSTLLEWHQHVVWMDPDVYSMPPALLTKMVRAGGDIIAPLCIRASNTVNATNVRFDARAYRTELRQWRNFRSDDARVRHRLVDARASGIDWTPLDSVGAKLLYVRADVHRQGVAFPYFNSLPDRHAGDDETDGIEAGGLCHAAHFVGYKCWGMPLEPVYHYYTDLGNWS